MKHAILIVDDDPLDRMLFQRACDSVGIGELVDQADSGARALELLGTGKVYTLLVTDLSMPQCNGFELVRAARLELGDACPPILVLSGSTNTDDVRKSYALNVAAFVRKPSSPKEYGELASSIRDFWMRRVEAPGLPLSRDR